MGRNGDTGMYLREMKSARDGRGHIINYVMGMGMQPGVMET